MFKKIGTNNGFSSAVFFCVESFSNFILGPLSQAQDVLIGFETQAK